MDAICSAYHPMRICEIFLEHPLSPSQRGEGWAEGQHECDCKEVAKCAELNQWRVNRARVLRSNATSAEDKLWLCLRDRRLGGFKFVRQFPIDGYNVDFACRKEHLIIEVDGGTHSSPVEVANDAKRAETLAALGYKIVRISNAEIYEKIEGVRDRLLALLEQRDV